MSTADHFYRDLEPFHHFVAEVFQERFYRPLPDDWLLVITDISGSTKAVQSGKYAEVNYVGAACIVAVHNALPQQSVPSVFGGDGATLAIPPSLRDQAVEALAKTQRWARVNFDLELRVGVVPVADLTARGAVIEVAKMEFSPHNAMAMFRGAGFDVADALLKSDDGSKGYRIEAPADLPAEPDLNSLSCRWSPMMSDNGVIVSLIVGACDTEIVASDATYREVLEVLNRITILDSAQSSPIKLSNLRARLRFSAMLKEVKTLTGPRWRRWCAVLFQHIAQTLVFRLSLRPGNFDPQLYKQEMTVNSDFRKVSGMLRLILDCTEAQADQIDVELTRLHESGKLNFGTHRSSEAIMTCVTPNVDNHEHVHFIDGGDGGLYSAARKLKEQMARHPT